MAGKTLDRSKPYGTIHHAQEHDGRFYEQNGTYFDNKGDEWVPPKSAEEIEAEKKAEFDAAVEKRALEILAQKQAEAATDKQPPKK